MTDDSCKNNDSDLGKLLGIMASIFGICAVAPEAIYLILLLIFAGVAKKFLE